MSTHNLTVEIIGAGTMGQAIARILANSGKYQVVIYDRDLVKAKGAARKQKIEVDPQGGRVNSARFVLLAVKPQDLADLAAHVKFKLHPQAIIISIAAGVTLRKLQRWFACKKMVRVMPNLGLVVGEGIAAWKAAGLNRTEQRGVRQLLSDLTENFEVRSENLLDDVTAISGSGPAYFFFFAQSLLAAALKLGIPANHARSLVEKTFVGAALLQQGRDYDDLIRQVASKGGTTEAALKVFRQKHLTHMVETAVWQARRRAKELRHG